MAKDEKTITKSENTEGNPYHEPAGSSKGGQFTSGPKGDASKDDDSLIFNIKEDTTKDSGVNISFETIMNFIGKKKEVKNAEAQEYIDNTIEHLPESSKEFYSKLSLEEKKELLSNSKQGYAVQYLKFATEKQLDALLYAECVLNQPHQLEQQIDVLEKKKAKINSDIYEQLVELNADAGISGIWYNKTVYPKDVKDLKESGSWEKKEAYYNEILNNPDTNLVQKASAKQYLMQMAKLSKDGENYQNEEQKLRLQHVDEIISLDEQIAEYHKRLNEFNFDSPIVINAKGFIEKFQDKNAAYSQARKNNATWIKGGVGAAKKHFGSLGQKHINSMTHQEIDAVEDYTSGSSKYNEPLRSMSYIGGKSFGGKTFSQAITDLTNAIDKCEWDEDIWVQRGQPSFIKCFRIPGKAGLMSVYEMTPDQLKQLEGQTFTDNGFFSAGAGKGTGRINSTILNVYCPKGTKMVYAEMISNYQDENEMILQRGYTYRITKVEKKSGQFYLDCEVILDSDKNKPIGSELDKIGQQYYHGY